MSKKAHTPGPWSVPYDPFVSRISVETHDEEVLIACPGSGGAMSYTRTICKLDWAGTEEWEANARLIAAAPEVLEALELLLAAAEMTTFSDQFPEECEIARAALSKATGGE